MGRRGPKPKANQHITVAGKKHLNTLTAWPDCMFCRRCVIAESRCRVTGDKVKGEEAVGCAGFTDSRRMRILDL